MPYGFASRPRRLRALFAALALVCLLATGCGSDSGGGRLLSSRQAGDLRASLNRIQQDVAAEDCTGAGQEVSQLHDQIDSIRRLNRELRSSLRSSVRRLETLVNDNCATTTTSPTETSPTTPDTGATGETGATGATGEQGAKKQKKPKKEKPPKDGSTPPGGDGQTPPGQQNGGGGAGVPGESNSNGSGD